MKFHTGGVSFDTAADRRWTVPVARIGGRYLATNPHALFLLLTRTSLTSELTPQAGEQSVQ
ncbi:MAG: hypothetical protein ABSA68_08495 [Xanthobacteraceae bacterium]|jgi:hypothetical protein